jgi:hypothetical protein
MEEPAATDGGLPDLIWANCIGVLDSNRTRHSQSPVVIDGERRLLLWPSTYQLERELGVGATQHER